MRRHELTAERLAETLKTLTTDNGIRERAAKMGERIRAEDGVGNAVKAFGEILSRKG
jgi:UDP:flavonoid glycosyltransferase YjiC (YdhE family)